MKEVEAMFNITIPHDINYSNIKSLSAEEIEKLELKQPANLWEASKIPGVTQSGLAAVAGYVKSLLQS